MEFLQSAIQQFNYYKMLGNRTFEQLTDDQLFWQSDKEANSIGVIVKHMHGNMLSRWTDFLTADGEKEWRKREAEFDADIQTRKELLEKWNEGWDCLFQALETVNESNVDSIIYIRNQGHSIVEAVQRQLAHYAYHVGQIVFLGRQLKKEEWLSLSIPRGGSKAFNEEKFSQEKRREHFTKEFLDKEKSKK